MALSAADPYVSFETEAESGEADLQAARRDVRVGTRLARGRLNQLTRAASLAWGDDRLATHPRERIRLP